ncbi:hypothetical protein [Paraburkholderia adhaesiva]|uniref:hypothetical protein n=1 Tax=Paraburkholderia adhaesiva TaxID=2883244 RepID=UPI001F449148|nr:hypothetical protein [Paraburkholderia adhaesiva]
MPEDNPVQFALEEAPAIANSTDTQLLLRDCYETAYGIYNHALDNRGATLSLVAMHEAEDISSGGLLYERIRLYQKRQVLAHFGLNLIEFLSLPSDLVAFVLEQSLLALQSGDRVNDRMMKEFQQVAQDPEAGTG